MDETQAPLATQWIDRPAPDDVARLSEQLGQTLRLPPMLARLLVQRGITEPEQAERFLTPSLKHLHDPALLPDADRAAQRLIEAVNQQQPIVIYGDYDVDGVTATTILYHTLTQLGGTVHTYVPHRLDEGYGLNVEAIQSIARGELTGGTTPLIISVDCGITACEPAAAARELEADLIITDHHQFDADALPDAFALVHPRLPGSPYPFGELCGAGVAFKLAWHTARLHCGSDRLPAATRDLMLELLSFAALGTVADVMPLVEENRVLVTFGLGRIKQTRFEGLASLIEASGLHEEKIDAYHVGFVLGPRLNACGRMGHAAEAVELLTTATGRDARRIAEFLSEQNDHRRNTERRILAEAIEQVEQHGYDAPDRRALVVAGRDWHPGVVGIVASRLVERYHRPTVVLCIDDDERVAKGSARSVDGVSIHEGLHACAEHLQTYGGHDMAAGLKLDADRVDAFRDALIYWCNDRLAADQLRGTLKLDATCQVDEISLDLVDQIDRLKPFGPGNRRPLIRVGPSHVPAPAQRIGQTGQHLRLTLTGQRARLKAVGFGLGDHADTLRPGGHIEVVAEPHINEWRGRRSAELHLRDLREV